jgi:RNA recognition motif-containing protein
VRQLGAADISKQLILKREKMNLYVGNLAREVSEDDLKQAFESFGQVESVNIIKDRFSGESRGFGFVEMPSKEEALKAMKEAQGLEIKGRSVRVAEANRRPSASGGGGRGRGGFNRGGRGGGRRGGFDRGERSNRGGGFRRFE